jgi:uncharacterized membrane protein YdfJ with MMPL/SSD domain
MGTDCTFGLGGAGILIPSLATLIGDLLWWPGRKPEAARTTAAPAAPPRRPRAAARPVPANES